MEILLNIPEEKAYTLLEILQDLKYVEILSKKDSLKTHFASEKVLAKDWLSKEEDLAWQGL